VTKSIDVPLSLVAPVQLKKAATSSTGGLSHVFKEAPIEIGHPIRGLIINDIEFRVDVTSRYDSGHVWDALGALILKDGELSIFCQKLGDQLNNDPYPVPLRAGYLVGVPNEVCGFTRWSVAIQDGDQTKVIQSFEAAPKS
jgi:hypothetical protein